RETVATLAACRCALHDVHGRDIHVRERRPDLAFGKSNAVICCSLRADCCFCCFVISECLCGVGGASACGSSWRLQLLSRCDPSSVDCYGLLCLLAHHRAEDLDLALAMIPPRRDWPTLDKRDCRKLSHYRAPLPIRRCSNGCRHPHELTMLAQQEMIGHAGDIVADHPMARLPFGQRGIIFRQGSRVR